jgi:predicted nucleotidyltransferase
MIDFHLILEKQKLAKAVDAFAAEMKRVLIERAVAGKRGWDKDVPADHHIANELFVDASCLRMDMFESEYTPDDDNERIIDIANRAMILWARHNSIEKQTKGE